MAKPFRGVINVDVTQSVPDWETYTQPIAPEGTPNVLYIVLDDVGYPGIAEVPESVAPNIRNRSYTVGVEVTIDSPDAAGVLFAHGSRFGGHALYVKDGKLKYVYNFVGDQVQVIESTQPLPSGRKVLSASFEREGDTMPAEGTLTLRVGEEPVGQGRIRTQPGEFSIAGEGLAIGKDTGEP